MPQKRYAVSRPKGHAGPKALHLQFRGAHVLEEGGEPAYVNFDPKEDADQMAGLRDRGFLIEEAPEIEAATPSDALGDFLLDAKRRRRPSAPVPAPAPPAADAAPAKDGGKPEKIAPPAPIITTTTAVKEEGK